MTFTKLSRIFTGMFLTLTISAATLISGQQLISASQVPNMSADVYSADSLSKLDEKHHWKSHKLNNAEKNEYLSPEEEIKNGCFVEELNLADETDQLVVVSTPYYSSGTASISYYVKTDNGWENRFSVDGFIGRNGLGKAQEGDGRTPVGVYSFTKAFGNKAIEYCELDYLQVDGSYYWVDDSYSQYYNQMVSTNEVSCDWGSAEHIAGIGSVYNYCLALSYNEDCVPGAGSAIFLHCSGGRSTSGCISIPEDFMRLLLENINDNCLILIDSQENLLNY